MSGKTIQIYLPNGDPRGMRIAEVTTRIVRVFEIPRTELSKFLTRPEANQVGVYFLFGENEAGNLACYIGQSGSVGERLKSHNINKDFWTRAIAVVSLTNNWTQTHVTYLEWLCLQAAKKALRYELDNGNEGSKPFTPEALEADCQEVFETVRFLTTALVFPPPFDELITKQKIQLNTAQQPSANNSESMAEAERLIYTCKGRGEADAQGVYTTDGFVVFKGSKARKDVVDSIKNNSKYMERRVDLLGHGKLRLVGEVLEFMEDVLFTSPSGASNIVMGRTSNGWVDWILPDGRTLHDVERSEIAVKI
jgi:Domain of unknown function (DUF4357)